MTNLDELLLQLVDGQALPLLQDGELGLLSIGGLVASKSMLLPLWDVIGHHADASHVGCNLPAISCKRGVVVCLIMKKEIIISLYNTSTKNSSHKNSYITAGSYGRIMPTPGNSLDHLGPWRAYKHTEPWQDYSIRPDTGRQEAR